LETKKRGEGRWRFEGIERNKMGISNQKGPSTDWGEVLIMGGGSWATVQYYGEKWDSGGGEEKNSRDAHRGTS